MLIDSTESVLVSHLGWVDSGSVWICATATAKTRQVKLSEAKNLSLHEGEQGTFSIAHHFYNNCFEITAHETATPEKVLARITVVDSKSAFDGDIGIWKKLPRAYVAYYTQPNAEAFRLFLVDAAQRTVELQSFEWFDDSYDHGYQGIIEVIEVPHTELLLVSVQRDSHPVLYDPKQRKVVQKLTLTDRRGNPMLRFRRTANELWADDYDTLLRLDPSDWSVHNKVRLQEAAEGTLQFIGNFSFNKDESLCVVGRPFSGDVVALDTRKFKVTHKASLGGQPLDAEALSNGRVFARDWKTGDLLRGELKRKFFA